MISAQPNTLITLSYNGRRQRSSLSDPNYGLMQTTYNAFGSENIHYLHTDHTSTTLSTGLGSWTAITNETGAKVDEQSYDACSVKLDFWECSEPKGLVEQIPPKARRREGNRRSPYTWRNSGLWQTPRYDRGFTGHEHLDGFQLINMNGRMYDPVIGRFMSPDPVLQFPNFTQGLNPYSYVLNNPLRYTDPSGYSLVGQLAAIGASIAFSGGNPFAAAAIYASVMTVDYVIERKFKINIGQIFEYYTQTFVVTTIQTGGSLVIGGIIGNVDKLGREILRATAHGVFNGTMRMAQGGKPAWLMPVRQV
jgi:RHS repeat-associated protein